jgi:hypothetical protein
LPLPTCAVGLKFYIGRCLERESLTVLPWSSICQSPQWINHISKRYGREHTLELTCEPGRSTEVRNCQRTQKWKKWTRSLWSIWPETAFLLRVYLATSPPFKCKNV